MEVNDLDHDLYSKYRMFNVLTLTMLNSFDVCGRRVRCNSIIQQYISCVDLQASVISNSYFEYLVFGMQ